MRNFKKELDFVIDTFIDEAYAFVLGEKNFLELKEGYDTTIGFLMGYSYACDIHIQEMKDIFDEVDEIFSNALDIK